LRISGSLTISISGTPVRLKSTILTGRSDYVVIQDIRDEGVTLAELSDVRCDTLIDGWEQFINRATGQFFISRTLSLTFDGNGSRLLQLPVPIIDCTALYINDDFTNALNSSEYVVYNRRGPVQDDRKNPRIKLKRSSAISSNIFSTTGGASRFEIGDMNIQVDGDWGYTEVDGSTPIAIKKAVMILVIATKEVLGDDELDQLKFGKVIEEVTDRHRIEYADLYNRLQTWAPTGLTEVDLAIQMYRSPMRVDAPRNINLIV
jgi:hypothetical protein